MLLVVFNCIGCEEQDGYDIIFYGFLFIVDLFGEKVEELNCIEEGIFVYIFDFDVLECICSVWGVFCDCWLNFYGLLKILDGLLEL